MLVLKGINQEQYLGGFEYCKKFISINKKRNCYFNDGEKKEYKKYITKELPKKIKTHFIYKENSPTIVKRRYIDNISESKVIGIYDINDEYLSKTNEAQLQNLLKKEIAKYDLVIVSDYGHGFISKKSASVICKNSKFLSLNAQVNASNIGYHTTRNYKKFNTLIINEKEIRHEMRDKVGKLETLMKKIVDEKKIENLIVTKGKSGSMLFNKKNNRFYYSDAYAHKIVDKIGAGDTMLSVISPCIKSKIDMDATLLVSSLAAAQSVQSMGNKNTINKIQILKTLENLFK